MRTKMMLALSCFFIIPLIAIGQSNTISRTTIITNALPLKDFEWTANANNLKYDFQCGGRKVYTPNWVKIGVNHSMPYCWGGNDNIELFKSLLLQNKSAGDACSKGGGGCSKQGGEGAGRQCATGVDCSGLISIAWNLARHYGTGELPKISTAYTTNDQLKPGDIVNKQGSHVRLVYDINSNTGLITVIEASGIDWKTNFHKYKFKELTGYSPRYYKNVIN